MTYAPPLRMTWTEYVQWKFDMVEQYEQAIRDVAAIPKIMEGLELLEQTNAGVAFSPPYRRARGVPR